LNSKLLKNLLQCIDSNLRSESIVSISKTLCQNNSLCAIQSWTTKLLPKVELGFWKIANKNWGNATYYPWLMFYLILSLLVLMNWNAKKNALFVPLPRETFFHFFQPPFFVKRYSHLLIFSVSLTVLQKYIMPLLVSKYVLPTILAYYS